MRKFYQFTKQAFAAIAATVACSAAFPAFAQPEPVTLYGVKIYCDGGAASGLYTIEATEGAQPQLYWADGDMMGNGGVVYADGTMYVLSYLDFFGSVFWTYLCCDVENKTYDYSYPETLDLTDVGSASTYDPSTGNVYTVSLASMADDSTVLSIMDLTTAKKTQVAPVKRMAAMAASPKGVLYGIDMDGNLNTINKHTGETTLVGATGVKPNANNTAVIDYKTGTMYWNAYTEEGGFLYTVDVATGASSLLSKFDPSMQFDGLFIIQTAQQENAPAAITDLAATFEGASLSGKVTFTMPLSDTDGNELMSDIDYKVSLDGTTLAEGSAAPGATVNAPVAADSRGNKQFIVEISNSAGASRPSSVMLFVGMDDPLAPEDATVTLDGLTATLTWTLPEKGVNGGYVDPAAVRTVVLRGPYDTLLTSECEGTEYVDKLDFEGVQPLMYGIVSYIDPAVKSEMAFSNIVTVGDCVVPPYAEDLTDIFRQLVFNIVDYNGDGCTWMYDDDLKSMVCNWPLAETSDDWLITAPVYLEEGKDYKVSAKVRSEGMWNREEEKYDDIYAGTLDICLGTGNTPEDMVTTLLEPTDVVSCELHELSTPMFSVPSTGTYHIGVHHSGPRSIYYTLINRLEVSGGTNALANVSTGRSCMTATAVAGAIAISNPEGAVVTVVTPDGRVVATITTTEATVPVSPGLYIVASRGGSVKVAL